MFIDHPAEIQEQPVPMKFIYKPFGIVFAILSGVLAKKVFNLVWGLFDKEEPPKPTTQETSWAKVVGAALVQGATFKATRAVVDRAGARSFQHLTGVWPGDKRPEKAQAAEALR
jgi:hypothetical protein